MNEAGARRSFVSDEYTRLFQMTVPKTRVDAAQSHRNDVSVLSALQADSDARVDMLRRRLAATANAQLLKATRAQVCHGPS